jgi:hypothetical protein
VACGVEGVDGGRSDLAAGASDEDSHNPELIFRFRKRPTLLA